LKRKEGIQRIKPDRASQLRGALKVGATILIALGVLASIAILYKRQTSSAGIHRMEYEGRVIDKSETIVETDLGSRVRRRLLIEGKDGGRFEVAVNEELYARVRKGMWIKRTSKGAELSWP
jgi:hypothetical protein